ncbi:hypothetical protein [Hydrogenophaga sp.]|uniref:hypothetical protein n=1 Tax=Hydrogenophaga sp. TaxID=1904254 RepID=UPI0035B0D32D
MNIGNRQIAFAGLASLAPALINVGSTVVLANSSDEKTASSALVFAALFFISIDSTQIGSTRLVQHPLFASNIALLHLADKITGLVSMLVFAAVVFGYSKLTGLPTELMFTAIALSPLTFIYSIGQTPIGILRTKKKNEALALFAILASISRAVVCSLFLNEKISPHFFVALFLITECIGGSLAAVCSKYYKLESAPKTIERTNTNTRTTYSVFLSSWFNSVATGLNKHLDIVLIGAFGSPQILLLYRPIKGLLNLVFNFSQTISQVIAHKLDATATRLASKRIGFPKISGTLLLTTLFFGTIFAGVGYLSNKISGLEISFKEWFLVSACCLFVVVSRLLRSMLIYKGAHRSDLNSTLLEAFILYSGIFVLGVHLTLSAILLSVLLSLIASSMLLLQSVKVLHEKSA